MEYQNTLTPEISPSRSYTTEDIRNDRWFKLKYDRFMSGLTSQPTRPIRSIASKPWYTYSFNWDNISEVMAKDSKYTQKEVYDFLVEQQQAAKLEALLEESN